MIDPYLLSVLAFFSILAVLIYRDRKKIDFEYFVMMRRTKRFRDLLDKIARISPSFWKIIGTIAIIICFIAMVFGTYNIIYNAYLIYTGVKVPAPALAIPIPAQQTIIAPGFIGIPFWFWIIVVATILIPHETFHGIIGRAEKIKLKNVGLVLVLLQFISIPVAIIYFIYTQTFDLVLFLTAVLFSLVGAFVEPDEKQLNKSKLMTKLRIFSAGSFINIIMGLAIIFLVQSLIWAPNVSGILITGVNETSPAYEVGLRPGMILERINNIETNMRFDEYSLLILFIPGSNTENITNFMSHLILYNSLKEYEPGDVVELRVSGAIYQLELGEHPEEEGHPYIGIYAKLNTKDNSLFSVLFPLLGMIALLNIFVGLFNILPIYPFDGGQIIKALAEKFVKKYSNQITIAITVFMLSFLVYSFISGVF
jgi:membrane-associated protease RseP (regulator of RpoE activity)